jgi:uncharacterized membrane protein (DUF441 family)
VKLLAQETMFLLFLLALGIFSKNNSVTAAVAVLLIIRWSTLAPYVFPWMKQHGLNLGIIIITIAVLIPIATGDVKFQELYTVINNPIGWIVILSGLLVAIFGGVGVELLKQQPHMTAGLILGTIFGVVFFKGIPVGPLIGAGIAASIIRLYEFIKM